MKKFNYFLFFFIIFLSFNVFAQDFNVTNTITSPTGSPSAGGYEGLEIYNTGLTNRYAVNTRYNGRLSRIRFNLPLPNNWPDGDCFSTGDLTYTITLNMSTNDWRNNFGTIFVSNNSAGINWFSSFTYVSRQQIKINFKIPNSTTCNDFIYVDIKSRDVSDVAFTGETNWNLSGVILTANFPSSGGGSSGGGSSSGATNQDIINNQNQNTQDIINNQNQNTQDIINNNNDNTQQIIENQNQNTQQQIESQKVCKNVDKVDIIEDNKALDGGTGLTFNNSGTGVTGYISIDNNTELTLLETQSQIGGTLCYYNVNKEKISCIATRDFPSGSTLTIPNNTSYFRAAIVKSLNKPQFRFCKNGNTAIQDSLTDDNVDSNVGTNFFDNFTSQDFGLSQIITIPLNTIQGLTSKTCIPLQVPIPFTNNNITLPCMTEIYETKFPSIYNLWKIVSFGIIAYFIAIDIFHIVKGFKDPESDKVEVLDL